MENLFSQSRTILNNKIYEKYRDERYKNHKNTVDKLRSSQSCYHKKISPVYLKNISRSKKANSKINKIFDPTALENRSLVRRLVDAQMKQNKVKSFLCVYNFCNASKKSQEKEKIKIQNQILKQKITAQKKKIISINTLKKQFKQHDRNVDRVRKLKYQRRK